MMPTLHLQPSTPSAGLAYSYARQQATGYGLGILAAAVVFGSLLIYGPSPGVQAPPQLNATRFSVAVLAGPKQAAQSAPENIDAPVVEDVQVSPTPVATPPVVAERKTSLPEAVKAAPNAEVKPAEAVKPVEVIPPARVSMPGGRLMAEDAPVGDGDVDPLAIKPRQVYIRLTVDENGKVMKAGIVRSGGDLLRDNLILKAMRSRTYSTASLMKVQGIIPAWQVDMVIDYGTNDFLP